MEGILAAAAQSESRNAKQSRAERVIKNEMAISHLLTKITAQTVSQMPKMAVAKENDFSPAPFQ